LKCDRSEPVDLWRAADLEDLLFVIGRKDDQKQDDVKNDRGRNPQADCTAVKRRLFLFQAEHGRVERVVRPAPTALSRLLQPAFTNPYH
jgi:hypothetical protein